MSISDLAIVAALVFAWGTLSARLERFDVTAPIIFVAAGLLLTHGPIAGLASVVFALLTLEELSRRQAGPVVTSITITVLLSVLAHGATADPIARMYAAKHASAERESWPPETGPADFPERRLIRRGLFIPSG